MSGLFVRSVCLSVCQSVSIWSSLFHHKIKLHILCYNELKKLQSVSVCLSFCLSFCQSVFWSVSQFFCLYMLSVYPSLSISQFVCLIFSLYLCMPVFLPVSPQVTTGSPNPIPVSLLVCLCLAILRNALNKPPSSHCVCC